MRTSFELEDFFLHLKENVSHVHHVFAIDQMSVLQQLMVARTTFEWTVVYG